MERKPSQNFQDLVVWQKAHQLVLEVYRYSESFPKEEMFGLTSQLRRAIISVAANIVEGFKKRGKPDKMRFINIAQGSLEECRYYFILAQDLQYGNSKHLEKMAEEVSKLMESYNSSIKSSCS